MSECKQPIDIELEQINKSRGIPQEVGDSAENFYNISRDISKEFLEKITRENSIVETKSRLAEPKDEESLPELNLQNYHSNMEFDRLLLKKEISENIIKHKNKDF